MPEHNNNILDFLEKNYNKYETPDYPYIYFHKPFSTNTLDAIFYNKKTQNRVQNSSKEKDIKWLFIKNYMNYIGRKNPKISKAILDKLLDEYHNIDYINIEKVTDFYNNIVNHKFLFQNKQKKLTLEINKIKVKLDNQNVNHDDITNITNSILWSNSFFKNNMESSWISKINDMNHSDNTEKFKKEFEQLDKRNNLLCIISDYYMEQVEDFINIELKEHQFNKVLKHRLTQENRKIWNSECYDILRDLITEKLTADDFHKNFISKIKKYKTTEELLENLKKFQKDFQGWNFNKYKEIMEKNEINYEVIDNKIIALIDNFEKSKQLGSQNWCISTDYYYFQRYNENILTRQFFIYDFNKEAKDPQSLIGVTLLHNNIIEAAHDKRDNNISRDEFLKTFINKNIPAISSNSKFDILYNKYIEENKKYLSYNNIITTGHRIKVVCGREYLAKFESKIMETMNTFEKFDFYCKIKFYKSNKRNKTFFSMQEEVQNIIKKSVEPQECFKDLFKEVYDGKKHSFNILMSIASNIHEIDCVNESYFRKYLIKHYSLKHFNIYKKKWNTLNKDVKGDIGFEILKALQDNTSKNTNRNKTFKEYILPYILENSIQDVMSKINSENDSTTEEIELYHYIAKYNDFFNFLDNDIIKEQVFNKDFFVTVLGSHFQHDSIQSKIALYIPENMHTDIFKDIYNTIHFTKFKHIDPSKINWKSFFKDVPDKKRKFVQLINLMKEDKKWENNKSLRFEMVKYIENNYLDSLDKNTHKDIFNFYKNNKNNSNSMIMKIN